MSQPNPFKNLTTEQIGSIVDRALSDSGVRSTRYHDAELLDPAEVDRVVDRTGRKIAADKRRKERHRAVRAENQPAGITVGKDAVAGHRPLTIREYAIGFVKMHHAKPDLKKVLDEKLDAVAAAFEFSPEERRDFVEAVENIRRLQEERESALLFLQREKGQIKAKNDIKKELVILRLIDDFQTVSNSPSVTAASIFADAALDPDDVSAVEDVHERWLKSMKKKN